MRVESSGTTLRSFNASILLPSQSREVDRSRRADIREANMYFLIEATIALSVSFFINLFVMAVFGQAFYKQTNQAAVRHTPYMYAPQVLQGTPKSVAKPSESLSCTIGTGRGGSLDTGLCLGSPFPPHWGDTAAACRLAERVSPHTKGSKAHTSRGGDGGGAGS